MLCCSPKEDAKCGCIYLDNHPNENENILHSY